MSNRVCLIDLPGLDGDLLHQVPPGSRLGQWLAGKRAAALTPSFPAVTCSVQATITTGVPPAKHGIVANGIATFRSLVDQALVDASNFASYRRDVSFWEQSNQFVEAPRFWQDAEGNSRFKTALLFFQNSMPGFGGTPKPAADIVLTPKPDHGPDGKLVSLCWSQPADLVPKLFGKLGPFPLMNYWGPMAGIASSQWIAKAAAMVWEELKPQLQLVYVPHLDYDLQRFGPSSPQATQAMQNVAAALDPLIDAVSSAGGRIVLLSEYTMTDVTRSIAPNSIFAEAGMLALRDTPDGRLIDYQRSDAFAMCDHQIAHIYTRTAKAADAAAEALESARVTTVAMDNHDSWHRRSGDLIALADRDGWFDYRWWSDPAEAPKFAGMVDIHRKPGYDPLELFWNRATNSISQDASLVRGSHGIVRQGEAIFVSDTSGKDVLQATDVAAEVLKLLA